MVTYHKQKASAHVSINYQMPYSAMAKIMGSTREIDTIYYNSIMHASELISRPTKKGSTFI
jgi:uncharacterized lipoprotein YehR (DUF1307 family)